MKRLRLKIIKQHLFLLGILPIALITFVFDYLHLKDLGYFNSLEYIHESLVSLNVIFIYLYLRRFRIFSERGVKRNLTYLAINLAGVYVLIFILKSIFKPIFIVSDFPPTTNRFSTIVYANIVSFVGSFSMVAFILSLRNLILYKYKKRTHLYFKISVGLIILTAILTVFFKEPLDLSFSGNGVYNNVVFSLALIFIFLLSTRNSWITYLTRKEKYYYLFASFIFLIGVSYLFDYAYDFPVSYHSLALAVFVNATWFFLLFYSILASFNFLLQLPTARIFERKMREVASLQNLSRAISVELNADKLAKLTTELILQVTGSNYAWIELFDETGQNLKVAAAKNLSLRDIQKLENGILNQFETKILQNRQSLALNELSKQLGQKYFFGLHVTIASLVGIPIIGINEQFFGILYAAKSSAFGFDPDDVSLLEAFANQVAIALENARLLQKSLERERLERELQIAREVQLRLLPQNKPQVAHYAVETLTLTAYEVGGDYYDFISKDENHLGIVIGDVSGKGTSAAFYMAETKGIIQSFSQYYHSPLKILAHANRVLSESLEKKAFITLLVAHIDVRKHRMRFARAGHCPVLYYKAQEKKVRFLQPPGIAVGLDRGAVFDRLLQEYELDVQIGDIFVLYTDGLSEAMNNKNEEYGEERLARVLQQNFNKPLDVLKQTIIDDVLRFTGHRDLHDDLTLVLFKRED